MSLSTQHIIRHLFQVESLEEVSRQQLEELVESYPSFGVGRYLLSRKLLAENADHFNEETQKTNLYFTNPFWLQWLLQEDFSRPPNGFGHISPVREDEATDTGHPAEDWGTEPPSMDAGLPAEEVFAPVVDTTEPVIDTEVPPQVQEPDEVGESLQAETISPSAADELLKSIAELRDRRQASEASPIGETEQPPIVFQEESPSKGIAGLALEQLEEEDAAPEEQSSFQELAPASVEQPIQEELSQMDQPLGEELSPVEQVHIEVSPSAEQTHTQEPAIVEQSSVEEASPVEQVHIPETPQTEQSPSGGSSQAPTEQPPTEEPAASAPIFEPYHTVDYFASQGIRLVLEENPSDKLGKQLKSFTDWLKVMRKLPQKNREIVPDIAAERQVQAIAAHSIERKEVITEAMAEVLAKQGMREKATEMYRKLSLLEPEKSAYFADKIEKLKII